MKRFAQYYFAVALGLLLASSRTEAMLIIEDQQDTNTYSVSPSGKYLFVITDKSPYARVSVIDTDNPNHSVVIGAYGSGKGPPQVLVSSDDKSVYVLSWPAVHDSEIQAFRHVSGLEFKQVKTPDPSLLPENSTEQQLNVIYQLLKHRLRAEDQELLVAEEKEWLAKREKLSSDGERDELTRKRINDLAAFFLIQVAPNSVL